VEDPKGGIRNIIPDRAKYQWLATATSER
jgi:hypothetical protein